MTSLCVLHLFGRTGLLVARPVEEEGDTEKPSTSLSVSRLTFALSTESRRASVKLLAKSRVKIPQEHIFMTSMCTRSPINGGKHQNASKYCCLHSELTSGEDIQPSHSLPTPHATDALLEKNQVGRPS